MRLVSEEGKSLGCSKIGAESMKVLSPERIEVLKLIAKEPMYPAQIAREMGMQVQAVYYHIKMLEKAGLAGFVEYEERGGAMAKKFASSSDALAIVLNNEGWREYREQKGGVPSLLSPFVKNRSFEGTIVLGSPDPHGKYRARGNELCMVEFAMLLGQYAGFSFPLYFLDTEVREKEREGNLVLAGGPKVNTLVAESNKHLPIRFEERSFDVYSTLSGKKYGENIGLVELLENPFNRKKKLLLLGGLNQNGTRAAVLALVKRMREVEAGNTYNSEIIAKVVEGFDDNGDGIVDAVEILE
ncbi:ArsR family transcriptional regulator [Candidatus Micrarchaeota archaeon]|nr:ArsR family transcriptional regulator [Candidatus Micrarchaeota archaeon]MBD3417980.1 ArsR family transcriptional regulator [Candidatus Micrarchaeota archaeon]